MTKAEQARIVAWGLRILQHVKNKHRRDAMLLPNVHRPRIGEDGRLI